MPGKDKNVLFESFGDRKAAVLMGVFCYLYFAVMYLPESAWIAKILPLWHPKVFGIFALAVVIAQAFVWKVFRHYQPGWYKHPGAILLFICEFGLLLFTSLFLSWPVYGLYRFLSSEHPRI